MDEAEQLTSLCRNLGASVEQAKTMAQQLSKRADQLAAARHQSREEAMAYLLRLLVQGQQGEVAAEFSAPPPQNNPDNSAK